MFNVGDRVKKISGSVFSNGETISTVHKVDKSIYGDVRVWLVHGGWLSPENIVLVEPAKIRSFRQFQRKLDGADVTPEAQRIRTGPDQTVKGYNPLLFNFDNISEVEAVQFDDIDEVGFDEADELWDVEPSEFEQIEVSGPSSQQETVQADFSSYQQQLHSIFTSDAIEHWHSLWGNVPTSSSSD